MSEQLLPPSQVAEDLAHEGVTRNDIELFTPEAALRGTLEATRILRKRAEEAEYAATHDYLTGVYNRAGLEQILPTLSEDGRPKFILYGDNLNFKHVNDVLGHKAGDDMLVATAHAITSSLRKGSVVARIGGDEWMAVIDAGPQGNKRRRDTIPPEAQMQYVRTRINDAMIEAIKQNAPVETLGFQLSVGVTEWKEGATIESLKAEAEAEMMRHKEQQRAVHGQHRKI